MNTASLSAAAKGSLYVVGGAICISFAPLFVHVVDVPPTSVAFYRLLFGAIALFAVALARRDRIVPDKSVFALMALAAAFFTADLSCWHQSILYIGPGLATILTNFQVFFLALIGVLFMKERMSLRLALSIAVAFAGLWLLLEVDIDSIPPKVAAGIGLALCTAAFYTGYILTLRRSQSLGARLPAVSNMAIISFMGMALAGLLALVQGQSLSIHTPEDGLLLALYGVGCQGLGWFLLSKGLPHLPASRAGLLMLTQPTLSFLWDVTLCGRETGFWGYCGAVLALLAIAAGVTERGTRKSD